MPIILEEVFAPTAVSAEDLIVAAARKLGAIQAGETLNADELNDSLQVMNSMLEFWSIDKLLIRHMQQETFTWAASQTSRTIGSGGNFDTTRPIKLYPGTFFRDSNNNDYHPLVTEDRVEYDRICAKTTTSTYPEVLLFDRNYPLASLFAYPVASVSLTLKLNSWKTLQQFNSLATGLNITAGYRWAIEHNLAVALQGDFGLTAPAYVVREADRSLAELRRVNVVPVQSSVVEAALVTGGPREYGTNIYEG